MGPYPPTPGRLRFLGLAWVAAVAWPLTASANAGTPLMWAAMGHLVFGNAAIGLLEGLLLAWIFRIPRLGAVGVMVGANYLSAWVGGRFLIPAFARSQDLDLHNVWGRLWVLVFLAYLGTLLLEAPFVAWLLRKTPGRGARTAWGSVVVQGVSHLLLLAWYASPSRVSLHTRAEPVEATALPVRGPVRIYYLGRDDGQVWERDLPGGTPRRIGDIGPVTHDDRLFFRPSTNGTGRWNLTAFRRTANPDTGQELPVLADLVGEAPEVEEADLEDSDKGTWRQFGPPGRLGAPKRRPWSFSLGFWAAGGVEAEREDTRELWRVAWETPLNRWEARNGVQLPGDLLLFQLGTDQICLLDPATRRIALVCRGRGVTAILPAARP